MSNPQVPVNGTLGTNGIFPLVNSPAVVFATDADHTMTYPEMSGSSGFLRVTSGVSLTAIRKLIAPMVVGFTWAIENATTGGYAIQVIGATGTGVTIPSGSTMPVYFDSINYVTTPAASGGTVLSVGATAPLASTGGTNPVLSLAQATAIVDGYLAHGDWATFNGKQAALGYTPAHSGANSDITSLAGLTTPLSTSQGGSGTAGGTGYRYGNGASPDTYVQIALLEGVAVLGTGSLAAGASIPIDFVIPYGVTPSTVVSASIHGPDSSINAGQNTYIVITCAVSSDTSKAYVTLLNTGATSWTYTGLSINVRVY